MDVKITFLVENTAPAPGWQGEYGFSALVEVDDKKFLFDTGSADALFKNTELAGINLKDIDGNIISHGHFDHTGGLLRALQIAENKTVYAHSNVFADRYASAGNYHRQIGSLASREDIEKCGGKLIFTDNFTEISPNIYITGAIPRLNNFEDVGGNFKVKIDGSYIDDMLEDDIALVIDHPDGLIVISGCAHAGIINILEYVRKKMDNKKILAFLGGTHLMAANENRIEQTIYHLEKLDVKQLVVAHCTGFYAAAKLYNSLGNKVIKGETGMCFVY
ncbi:MAG TPA: MBL fold metallo-hydrolase [Syntrophomonadaceae bacterium]|nr:MBL fold metallo-hydrolase [Syntrophomonadaceae bacterium]